MSCASPGLHLITNMHSWTTIQQVSYCSHPGLHLNHWHALMTSDPGSKLLYIFHALFESLTCLMIFYPASELLCTFWVLFESLIWLYEIPSSLWVVVHLLGSIWITDMPSWYLIQAVSCCAPHRLYSNHWHVFMKFYPGCELLHISWAPFESLISLHEIPSRMWVVVHLMGSIWITDMPLWNFIQIVSCTPFWLYLNH